MAKILFTVAVILFSVFQNPAIAQISGTRDPTVLPFDRPSRTALAASSHKVLAHWHSFPFRYYTTDGYVGLLSPTGSQFSYSGGYLRGRPLPFAPPATAATQSNGDIRDDMTTDITFAAEIGIDAFLMNIWYGPSGSAESWRWTYQLQPIFDAAEQYTPTNASKQLPGFSIVPSIDALILSGHLNNPTACGS